MNREKAANRMSNANRPTAAASLHIEAVVENLPAGLEAMRAEALSEDHGFIERLAADWASGAARFDRGGEALLAATMNGALAGIGGITLDPFLPGCLRMRRFYVRPLHRRLGVARALAIRLLDQSAASGRPITVNASRQSFAFWESLGFLPDARDGHTHFLERHGT